MMFSIAIIVIEIVLVNAASLGENAITAFDSKVEKLWIKQKGINESLPFIYHFSIVDDNGKEYRYVGKAKNYDRLKQYKRNMRRIRDRKPRRTTPGQEKYRAVHFALYKAIENDWDINIYRIFPLKACSKDEFKAIETQFIHRLKSNLNKEYNCQAGGWAIEDLNTLKIENFVPND